MSQNEKVLNHLKEHNSITTYESYEKYGITRLAARISDLRDEGYLIRSETVKGKNRDGKKISYCKYILVSA